MYADDQHARERLKNIEGKLFPGGAVPEPWHGWQDDMSYLYRVVEDRIKKNDLFGSRHLQTLTQGVWLAIEELLLDGKEQAAEWVLHSTSMSREECEWCAEQSGMWEEEEKQVELQEFLDDAFGVDEPKEDGFDKRLEEWVASCQRIINAHFEKNYAGKLAPYKLTIRKGKKYVKIIQNEHDNGGSAWAFVNMHNGDILKPASWSAPAKHARGNIFDEHKGMKWMGVYGAAYLK